MTVMESDDPARLLSDGESPAPVRGASSQSVRRATGRDRDEWFALLDSFGRAGRPYRENADWLTGEHGVSRWWAQKLIVEYEGARGLRPPGVRPDGTFEVLASKTIGVPVERLFAAFVDPELRERWLPGAALRERGARPGRSVRFDWDAGTARLTATFAGLGEARSQVGLRHERLPDARAAEEAKAYWRERLDVLKALLETTPPRRPRPADHGPGSAPAG